MNSINVETPETGAGNETLTFPFTAPPADAEIVDISAEVKWLRLAMPYALDHVNVYLLRLEQGWLIVDTGIDSPATRSYWEEIFSGPLRGEKVAGVCCTHYHIDHVGLAGYLTERWHLPLYMSCEAFFLLRGWPADLKELPWQHDDFFRKAGYPREKLEQTLMMFDFSREVSPVPHSFIQLQDGMPFPAGGDWQVFLGDGHAQGHVMLHSPRQGILITGDQLLPRISSNVSVNAVNHDDEPLSRWLASLDRLGGFSDDTLVLPGHELPFRGIRQRVAELHAHHAAKFDIILEACAARHYCAYELVPVLYPQKLNAFDLQMALGECQAHIRYLLRSGRLSATVDPEGAIRYRPTDVPSPA